MDEGSDELGIIDFIDYTYKGFNDINYIYNIFNFLKYINYFYIKFDNSINMFCNFIYLNRLFFILNLNFLTQFKCGVDMTCIDFYFRLNRFKLLYNYLSIFYNKRLFIHTFSNLF